MKDKKIVYVVCAIVFIALIGASVTVSADTQNVTTRWIVPADTTIAVSFPTGQVLIEFDATGEGMDFVDLAATDQNSTLAALRVTNNGNTNVEIEFNWTASWPTGVEYVNISVGDDTNATSKSFASPTETTKQTMVASLAMGTNEDFWFWTTGHGVEETAGVDRTLRVTSTNV